MMGCWAAGHGAINCNMAAGCGAMNCYQAAGLQAMGP